MGDLIDGTGFDGKWRMDLTQSRLWDRERNEWVPETLSDQHLEIRHDGNVMHYKISVTVNPELTVYMGYTCRFDDEEWAPYSVVEIDGDPDDAYLKPGDLLKSGIRLHEPIAYVKQIYVDPRTQYRITRNPDGTAQYAMLRRLSKDGTRNTGTVFTPDGVASIRKVFVRE